MSDDSMLPFESPCVFASSTVSERVEILLTILSEFWRLDTEHFGRLPEQLQVDILPAIGMIRIQTMISQQVR